MMLIDSNIIIYAAQPANGALRALIAEHAPAVSAVSYFRWIAGLSVLNPIPDLT